ncbi:MAG: flagellar basal body-associated FliL family protein [Alphaproteobacteria bacterium]|nr:flagellar basal body-associated FliL family protein [Alphaproteobacteria bacterium]
MSKNASRSRMVQIYVACVLLFVGLAACGYLVADQAGLIKHPAPVAHAFVSDMTYVDLPRMMVDVGSKDSSAQVQVDISLEIASKDKAILEGYQPRITDKINDFLSQEPPEEIARFSSTPWIRQELLRQVNGVGSPVPVYDVLLRQMLIL